MNRRERRAAGLGPPTKATRAGGDTPAALHQAGLGHRREGRNLDAQMCCQQALAIDPDHADTLHLMGLLSLRCQAIRSCAGVDHPRRRAKAQAGISVEPRRHTAATGPARGSAEGVRQGDAAQARRCRLKSGRYLRASRPTPLLSFQQALKLESAPLGCRLSLRLSARRTRDGSRRRIVYFDLVDRLQPNQAVILQMRGRGAARSEKVRRGAGR